MISKRMLLAVAVLALVLAGCGKSDKKTTSTKPDQVVRTTTAAGGSGGGTGNAVQIKDFSFKPGALKVKTGTKVTFTNADSADHTATSTGGPAKFDSGHLGTGKSFSFTFAKKGTYQYHCDIHNSMTGTVEVS